MPTGVMRRRMDRRLAGVAHRNRKKADRGRDGRPARPAWDHQPRFIPDNPRWIGTMSSGFRGRVRPDGRGRPSLLTEDERTATVPAARRRELLNNITTDGVETCPGF